MFCPIDAHAWEFINSTMQYNQFALWLSWSLVWLSTSSHYKSKQHAFTLFDFHLYTISWRYNTRCVKIEEEGIECKTEKQTYHKNPWGLYDIFLSVLCHFSWQEGTLRPLSLSLSGHHHRDFLTFLCLAFCYEVINLCHILYCNRLVIYCTNLLHLLLWISKT